MAKNKSMQYGVTFLIFVGVMATIAMLNNKISQEIGDKPSQPVAVAVPAVEEVRPVNITEDIPEEKVIPLAPGEFSGEPTRPPVAKEVVEEPTEPVYELPLKEENLPL